MKFSNILLSLLLLSTPCMAAAVDPVNQQDPNFINVLNDDLQKINGQQILMNTSYSASKLTGVLLTSQGGTSKDLSAAAANTIPYFSATGVMGNVGIGTTGNILTWGNPPGWSAAPSMPKVIYANSVVASLSSGTGTTSTSTTISGTGDWAGKGYAFLGGITFNYAADGGACVVVTNNTGTDKSFFSSHTLYDHTFGNGCLGDITASFGISAGNLVATVNRSADGSGNNANLDVTITGIFIREI